MTPLPGFNGIKKDEHAMICRESDHLVDPSEIRFVRFGEIVVCSIVAAWHITREGANAVVCAAVVGTIVVIRTCSEDVDPKCVETARLTIR